MAPGQDLPHRVWHQLQVDLRGLDRGVPQPATEIVDRNAVQQQVTGMAVAQRVDLYAASWSQRT